MALLGHSFVTLRGDFVSGPSPSPDAELCGRRSSTRGIALPSMPPPSSMMPGAPSPRSTRSEVPPAPLLRRHVIRRADDRALGPSGRNRRASVVLSGAATAEQLRSNLAALHIVVDDPTQARLRLLAKPSERYWSERSRLAWV